VHSKWLIAPTKGWFWRWANIENTLGQRWIHVRPTCWLRSLGQRKSYEQNHVENTLGQRWKHVGPTCWLRSLGQRKSYEQNHVWANV